ncbi:voltage-gated potassium channel [Modicisalibacter muralis]|uniref:Voltage-gated potassium channel n=1 Tax=Modicisalibacter muralis TaxID=119000 RepID=A0A1G9JMR5_9GAMM|nr:ion transporter [Halomonas muralis]SDL38525.1 voltage-gated potassium channel [Halomonas muralis]
MPSSFRPADTGLRTHLFQLIFESDTRSAKAFDIALISLILISVAVVMLDSVPQLHARFAVLFDVLEWAFTLVFSLELALRLYCLDRPWRYLKSFYGVIDLLSILPTWLGLLIPGAQSLLVVRVLRVLRVFRVLRLMEFVSEGRILMQALQRSQRKVLLFLSTILMLVVVFGSLVYLIEPPESGFTSIPKALYWAIVTLTTVGYGDIAPITPLGQFVSSIVMILGYAILAVPTGVFSAEMIRSVREERYSDEACPGCGHEGHERDARYCRRCGSWLDEEHPDPNAPAAATASDMDT